MEKYLLDRNWEYVESTLQNPLMVNILKGWKRTDLPHDYSMEKERDKDAPGGLDEGFTRGAGIYYRKNFVLKEAAADKKIWLEFEGISGVTEVWLNQKFLAKHRNPYTGFCVDVTDAVKTGENVISLHTDSSMKPSSRWYVGTGIYRPVWLYISEKTAIVPNSLKIAAESIQDDRAEIWLSAKLCVGEDKKDEIAVRAEVFSKEGEKVNAAEVKVKNQGEDTFLEMKMTLDRAVLWSPENPYLYTVKITVDEQESCEEKFGVRTVCVSAENGFQLNGKTIKLKGGCIHQDLGIFGVAEYRDAEKRKIIKLKESGFNALRLAHNPFGRTFFDLCDELGMLVIEEAYDEWVLGRTSFGSHLFFESCWEQDLEDMIDRDYNHPSIVMWSVGNEVEERDGSADGYTWSRKLAEKVKSMDKFRPVSATACSLFVEYTQQRPEKEEGTSGNQALNMAYDNFASGVDLWGDATEKYFEPMDVAGYNYKTARYEFDHEKFPKRVIYGSESYPRAAYQAWKAAEENDHVIGDFVWTAWDYIGEVGVGRWEISEEERPGNPEWPWLLANCSDIDILGDKRPQSFYRDVLWNHTEKPHLFVLPPELVQKNIARLSWAWLPIQKNYTFRGAEGKLTEAYVYANADEVELFVNGKSLGRKECGEAQEYIAVYSFLYEPGKLEVISYKDGKKCGRDVLRTAAETQELFLEPETENLMADGRSLMFIRATAVDSQGIRVMEETREAEIFVENGTLAASGTADPKPDRKIPYRGNKLPLFEGRMMFAVKSDSTEETCRVTVSFGEKQETIEIPLVQPEENHSVYVEEIRESAVDIPLEKLLDDPAARKILEKYLPELSDNPMLQHMKGMSLKKLSSMGGMKLSDDMKKELEEVMREEN